MVFARTSLIEGGVAGRRRALAAALQAANESKQIALDRGNSKENTQITAEAYLSLADVKRQAKNCAEALGDSQTALQAYKDYLKDNPGSPLAVKVAALEAKTASPTTTK